MDLKSEDLEEKLKSLLGQLQAERGIFERLVYKNKNQHRRSSYFQYLLKVRRDLRLLQLAKLEELLGSCFQVITGKRPKLKVHLLESLKRRKCDDGKHNFLERLLGAARLLSQMVEPMLKAATEVSTLLARSFFMGFSLTILALLARLRVLVQQVYREFYPVNEEYITLECVWNTDKFELLERSHTSEKKSKEGDWENDLPIRDSAVRYQSIESFLGDDEFAPEKADADREGPIKITDDKTNLLASPSIQSDDVNQVDGGMKVGEISGTSTAPGQKIAQESSLLSTSCPSPSSKLLKAHSGTRKVAFVSVKRPAPATSDTLDLQIKEPEKKSDDGEDEFYNLLTGGNLKDSLF
ncbi:uncharacterized protein LOC18054299 isoform X2 [Citrus clementina]|uniref:uncharacterized protein LOC18054299 isoform X2 n=1 Tax=Citrus clementina TaxID=85681 RepID=UPI000CED288D|nr:uncharacterized protein LOC18054299 isoform X2 [Citrus x clementina]